MNALHIVLLAVSAVMLAAVSAGSANLRRRSDDLPLIGYIISGALLVGNSASLLPTAPGWYKVAMIAVSLAGVAWFFISVASACTSRTSTVSDAQLASNDIYAGRMPTRPAPARHLHVVQATVAQEPMEPATAMRMSEHTVATQETFDDAAPAGARATTGPTYVAANIEDYVDVARTRRSHGRYVARTHTHMDPTERFLRLADAYSIDRGPRSLGRSSLA